MCVVAISTFSTGKYAGFDRITIICGSVGSNIPCCRDTGFRRFKRVQTDKSAATKLFVGI